MNRKKNIEKLLSIAEQLGWRVERHINDNQDMLEISRRDGVCAQIDSIALNDCYTAPPSYGVSIPAAEQDNLVQIVRKCADNFDINAYITGWLMCTMPILDDEIQNFVSMESEAKQICEVMKNFCTILRRLRSMPEFRQATDARTRASLLEDAVTQCGADLDGVDGGCGYICYHTESLGRCIIHEYSCDSDLGYIDEILYDIDHALAHPDDTVNRLIANKYGYEYDYAEMLWSAHQIKADLETLAESLEREVLAAESDD